MKKSRIIDFLIIFFAYLFCASFPIDLIIKDNQGICYFIKIILLICFLVFFFIYKKKTDLEFKQNIFNIKNFLLLLPAFLVCGSNFTNFLVNNAIFVNKIDDLFIFKLVLTIFTAIDEEIVFRYVFENNLNSENKLTKILITSLVFGISHLSVFLSTFDPSDLIIILYTFASGIVLGLLYEYVENIYLCMSFHFLFNFVNSILFEYTVNCKLNLTYYLCNIGVSLIVGIYLLIIYLLVLKKEKK